MTSVRCTPDRELRQSAEVLADCLRQLSVARWPTHLYSIARRLQVTSIDKGPLLEDGKTWWDGDEIRIRLRADRSIQRQRFTLAHELAHVALSHRSGAPFFRAPWHQSQEERVCDLVAAALLMPEDVVRDGFLTGPVSLRALKNFSDEGRVSMAACALRVNQLTGRHLCLVRATADEDGWRVDHVTGLTKSAAANLSILSAPALLEGSGSGAQKMLLSVQIGKDIVQVRGEGQCRYGHLLVLFQGFPPSTVQSEPSYP
jgi:Zn-dependent peptidase ImmA (M78 family)